MLRERTCTGAMLNNPFQEHRQRATQLCAKRQNYSLFVSEHFLPPVDPLAASRLMEKGQSVPEDIEKEKLTTKKKNYELFARKRQLGNSYLKENRVVVRQEGLQAKAKSILRTLSIHKEKSDLGKGMYLTEAENSLVAKKKALLAMNRLSERIQGIKDHTVVVDRKILEDSAKTVREVDIGLVGDSGSSLDVVKTSILLKLSLISTLEESIGVN
jgi:hypothetical protein